jgi:hypothetical protein
MDDSDGDWITFSIAADLTTPQKCCVATGPIELTSGAFTGRDIWNKQIQQQQLLLLLT